MSSIKISPVESGCSLPLFSISEKQRNSIPVTEINLNNEIIPLKNAEKQITFEVKSNTFNRKIEVKTKQEDTICSINKYPPTITCSTTNQFSPPKSTSKFTFVLNIFDQLFFE
jgi:hypothetical protein